MSIPRNIHYVWLGSKKFSTLHRRCITSWHTHLPETKWKYFLWNEHTLPTEVTEHPYYKKMYTQKHWSFLSDFIRFWALEKYGGIYMDTDMEVIKPLDKFLNHYAFVGKSKDQEAVESAIIGSEPGTFFLKKILSNYSANTGTGINDIGPAMLSQGIKKTNENVVIYQPEFFFPFSFEENFTKKCIKSETHTIHWWEHSWGSSLVKVSKKLGLLKPLLALKQKFF